MIQRWKPPRGGNGGSALIRRHFTSKHVDSSDLGEPPKRLCRQDAGVPWKGLRKTAMRPVCRQPAIQS